MFLVMKLSKNMLTYVNMLRFFLFFESFSHLEMSNPGSSLTLRYQFINVEDFEGRGESQPTPYFYQNLGEAEYCVALFMYMQLGRDTNLKIDSSE